MPRPAAVLRRAVALALLLPAAATAAAGQDLVPQLGGTYRLRVSDEYFAYYSGIGGTITAAGATRAFAADPQLFDLPITTLVPNEGLQSGSAGLTFALDGRVFTLADFGEFGTPYAALDVFSFTSGGDDGCRVVQESLDLMKTRIPGSASLSFTAPGTNRIDEENNIVCNLLTGSPLFGEANAAFDLLDVPPGGRFDFVLVSVLPPTVVPEPATWALTLAGLVGVAGCGAATRRRARTAAPGEVTQP